MIVKGTAIFNAQEDSKNAKITNFYVIFLMFFDIVFTAFRRLDYGYDTERSRLW